MAHTIRPRKMDFPFDHSIPKHWLGGSLLGSHIANGLSLVFPEGERFFMRSVRHYLDRIQDDPELMARVRGFCAQEGFHAREHESHFALLEEQGFKLGPFMEIYDRYAWQLLEPNTPPKIRLAITVALEHYTAMLAERALARDLLDDVHPVMRDLLRWHASEEIEHKSVAFDVLARVDPSYRVRIAGLIIGTIGLLTFWVIGTKMLIEQDSERSTRRLLRELKDAIVRRDLANGDILRAFLVYLRPDFHPSMIANDHLAQEFLARLEKAA